jgi:hypothetical protein
MGKELGNPWDGAPPEGVGAGIAWLASAPEAAEYNGMNIEGQEFVHERELYPDWRTGPDHKGTVGDKPTIWA